MILCVEPKPIFDGAGPEYLLSPSVISVDGYLVEHVVALDTETGWVRRFIGSDDHEILWGVVDYVRLDASDQ